MVIILGSKPFSPRDLWHEQRSGSLRDQAHPHDPAVNTPGDLLPATHAARGAATWSDPAARGERLRLLNTPFSQPDRLQTLRSGKI